jgi:hypothetical protein
VSEIYYATFQGCTSLSTVNIPKSVTSIGNYAFEGCTSLTSINIPESITSIGKEAFQNCSSLTNIRVDENNQNYSTSEDEKVLFNKDKTTLIYYPSANGDYTIPNSVTSISEYAFYNCKSLTSINIPSSVTSIGNSAFYYCSKLTSVDIPDSVTSIGNGAFYSCSNLRTINYTGTDEQWNAISKGTDWNTGCSSYTINYNYQG